MFAVGTKLILPGKMQDFNLTNMFYSEMNEDIKNFKLLQII